MSLYKKRLRRTKQQRKIQNNEFSDKRLKHNTLVEIERIICNNESCEERIKAIQHIFTQYNYKLGQLALSEFTLDFI